MSMSPPRLKATVYLDDADGRMVIEDFAAVDVAEFKVKVEGKYGQQGYLGRISYGPIGPAEPIRFGDQMNARRRDGVQP